MPGGSPGLIRGHASLLVTVLGQIILLPCVCVCVREEGVGGEGEKSDGTDLQL